MSDDIIMTKFMTDHAQEIVDFRLQSFRSPFAGMNLPAEQQDAISAAFLRLCHDCTRQGLHSNDALIHLISRASNAERLAAAATTGTAEKHLAAELKATQETVKDLRGQLAAIKRDHGILPPALNQPPAAPASTPKPPSM